MLKRMFTAFVTSSLRAVTPQLAVYSDVVGECEMHLYTFHFVHVSIEWYTRHVFHHTHQRRSEFVECFEKDDASAYVCALGMLPCCCCGRVAITP